MGLLDAVRMPGLSIARADAAAWVTDFLNAAYYAREPEDRDVDDLRLAFGVLTTRWHRHGRLTLADLPAFHAAFGAARLAGRGRLDREALLEGGCALLGPSFPDDWATRRAHGVAFASDADRDAFDPAARLEHGALGPLTPPRSGSEGSTYPAVTLPDAPAALAFLQDPARWPDMGSAAGRFTAVRPGPLLGCTFEIEVVLEAGPRALAVTRGYVTCTRLEDGLIELTTHAGHFLGAGTSTLRLEDGTVRDVGVWDPLPPHLAAPYRLAGRAAQHAFWGPDDPERSMLAQLARVTS